LLLFEIGSDGIHKDRGHGLGKPCSGHHPSTHLRLKGFFFPRGMKKAELLRKDRSRLKRDSLLSLSGTLVPQIFKLKRFVNDNFDYAEIRTAPLLCQAG